MVHQSERYQTEKMRKTGTNSRKFLEMKVSKPFWSIPGGGRGNAWRLLCGSRARS